MKIMQRMLISIITFNLASAMALAQAPTGRPARPLFWVTTTAWPDGGEVPMKYAAHGENKSPAFEFHWNLGTNPGTAPENLQNLCRDSSRCREFRQQNNR
jgi:hypothetical protein